ncbi:hypothetical protein J3459_011193 [Metarhizium acridum]|nr:hypothetical protein J3459_011193 [Metarhizium acridum]
MSSDASTPVQAEPTLASLEPPYSIFDKGQKWIIVILASTAATFSGFASNIYFPALPTIAQDLGVSIDLVNLTVTSYLVFQGLAPSLWGPISDVKGRRSAYICTFLVFLGACIGLAETKNYATLIVLRCLQSTGSASTIAIGAGVIGDITTRAERGGYMGIFQAGLLVPVAVGPVIGGAIAGSLGWKAIFWFLAIYSGIFLCSLTLLLPETLRALVVNGSRVPSNPILSYPLQVYRKKTKVQWQATQIDKPDSRTKKSIDLLGSIIGTLVTGKILDADYRRVKIKYEASFDGEQGVDPSHGIKEQAFPLEKARLRLVPIFSAVQCASILLFGWTIQYPDKVHIAVPIVSTFLTGWTAVSTQSLIMTYLVDVFPDRSAAASASLNLARCLFAAAGTSFIMPMINGVGVGVAFTICVAVQLVALIGPLIQWKFAAKWRKDEKEGKRSEELGR